MLVDPRLGCLFLMVDSGPWFQSPQRTLGAPGGGSAISSKDYLGLLHGGRWFMPSPVEDARMP